MRLLKAGILVLLLAGATGCWKHTYTTGTGASEAGEPAYDDWNHYFLFGLIGESKIDLKEVCPSGNALVKEKTSFVNGLLRAFIGIIYAPTTTRVWCGPGGASTSAPETQAPPASTEP